MHSTTCIFTVLYYTAFHVTSLILKIKKISMAAQKNSEPGQIPDTNPLRP